MDGDKDNGRFTAALLQHISTQNQTIEDLFKKSKKHIEIFDFREADIVGAYISYGRFLF